MLSRTEISYLRSELMDLWLIVAVIVFFVVLGGLFAAAEIALISLRDSQLAALEKKGRAGQRVAALARDPNTFLGAVQIGVTVSGFFSAAFGAASLSPLLSPVLESWGLSYVAASTIAVTVFTLAIAYLSLVFGELAPKRLALQKATTFALFMTPALSVLAVVLKPLIWIVARSSDLVVRALGGDPSQKADSVSAEELMNIVETHESLGDEQREILFDVLDVSEKRVSDVLKPRPDVVTLSGSLSVRDALASAKKHPYSRYPVADRSLDECTSFVHVRDLIWAKSPSSTVAEVSRPIPTLPSTMSVIGAISQLRAEGKHMGLVVDEYGGADGLVTLEDLIEELIGEVYDEHDPADVSGRISETSDSGVVPGDTSLHDMDDLLGVELPRGPYSTLAGFVMASLGRIAQIGDTVEWEGHVFTVNAITDRRIETVSIGRHEDGSRNQVTT